MDINKQILEGIKLASTGVKAPVLFISGPGLGKTTVIKNYCKDNNYELFTLLTSQYSPEDIAGFPGVVDGEIIKYNPDWLKPIIEHYKKEPNKPAVLFLDEITTASRATQGAILNLIFDRKVNDYSFPENLIILSAGNRSIDLLEDSDILIAPIKTRFAVINLIPALDDYLSFIDSNCNEKITNFFKSLVDHLYYKYKQDAHEYNPNEVINEFSGRGIYYLTSYFSKCEKIDKEQLYRYIQYFLGIEIRCDKEVNYLILKHNYKLDGITEYELEEYRHIRSIDDYYKHNGVILNEYIKMSSNECAKVKIQYVRFQEKLLRLDPLFFEHEDTKRKLKSMESEGKKFEKFCNNLNITSKQLEEGVVIKTEDELNKIKEYIELSGLVEVINFETVKKSSQDYIDEITNRWNYLEKLNIRGEL